MSRPFRGQYAWGQRVAYWRDQKSRKATDRRRQPGYLVGTIVGKVPPARGTANTTQANYLVLTDAGRTVAVAPEQL